MATTKRQGVNSAKKTKTGASKQVALTLTKAEKEMVEAVRLASKLEKLLR